MTSCCGPIPTNIHEALGSEASYVSRAESFGTATSGKLCVFSVGLGASGLRDTVRQPLNRSFIIQDHQVVAILHGLLWGLSDAGPFS